MLGVDKGRLASIMLYGCIYMFQRGNAALFSRDPY